MASSPLAKTLLKMRHFIAQMAAWALGKLRCGREVRHQCDAAANFRDSVLVVVLVLVLLFVGGGTVRMLSSKDSKARRSSGVIMVIFSATWVSIPQVSYGSDTFRFTEDYEKKRGLDARTRISGMKLAERGGFEPPVELMTLRRFSKPLLSTTQPSLREVWDEYFMNVNTRCGRE